MRILPIAMLALPFALGACVAADTTRPATTQVITQTAPAPIMQMAPSPPPAPQAELVPPPPPSPVPMVWQPGHWAYSGNPGAPWNWMAGQYVTLPPGNHAWVPGQWVLQGGGYAWMNGHWA